MPERVRGYLVVTVCEATGKNKDDVVVWDPSFVEGFVKGRGRGTGWRASEREGNSDGERERERRRTMEERAEFFFWFNVAHIDR